MNLRPKDSAPRSEPVRSPEECISAERVRFTDVTSDVTREFLRLEAMASAPYADFVFNSADAARAAQVELFRTGAAEYAPPYGRLALVDGSVVGMLACLTGSDLQRRRLQSSLVLARSLRGDRGEDLRERIRLAATTLLRVASEEMYLSRIAVTEEGRGLGLGRLLLEHCEQTARERGCPRLVLEVSPVHERALRVYRRAGFEQRDDRRVACVRTGRTLRYLHLEKGVSGASAGHESLCPGDASG